MPLFDREDRYSHEMRQHSATDLVGVKGARGRWLEVAAVVAVLAVLSVIGFRLISKFVGEAQRTTLAATEYSVLVAVRCAVIIEGPDDDEWDAFCGKYSEWNRVTEFANGKTELEKRVAETLDTEKSAKLFVRLDFDGREVISARATKDPAKETE